MSEWEETVRVELRDLSLEVPASLVPDDRPAIDSDATVLRGEGLTVIADSGPFADPLDSHAGMPEYRADSLVVGGLRGRMVSFRDPGSGTRTVGVHIPAPTRLTVVVQADASVPHEVPEQVVNSIQLASKP